MTDLAVLELGAGPRVVLVHGSILGGEASWPRQLELADQFRLAIPDRRGFGASPPAVGEDFLVDADDLAELLDWEPAHLVGHSYGAIACLLAAARHPEAVRSLVAIEPPAFGLARDRDDVERLVRTLSTVLDAPEPSRDVLVAFLAAIGGDPARVPDPLPESMAEGVRLLVNARPPWEAEIPLEALAAASFPKLVVSGGHSTAFEALCDVLGRGIGAERAVLPGRGHAVHLLGRLFNEVLVGLLSRVGAAS